jgi:acetolactate synthase regulatory subunit
MERKTKFRLRIDPKLLIAINRVVERRGITISALTSEAMERMLREEAGKKMATKRVVQLKKKDARLRRRPLQRQE